MARRSPMPLILAAVVAVALVVRVRIWAGGDTSPSRTDCIPLNVTASSENAGLLAAMADDYTKADRTVDGRCVDLHVNELPSGTAAQALVRQWDAAAHGPRPDVWTPAASAWAALLAGEALFGRKTLPPSAGGTTRI